MKKPRKLRLRKRVSKNHQAMVDPWPRSDTKLDVRAALGQIQNHNARLTVQLLFLGGLTQQEVGESMDVPRSVVQDRLKSGLEELVASLQTYKPAPSFLTSPFIPYTPYG